MKQSEFELWSVKATPEQLAKKQAKGQFAPQGQLWPQDSEQQQLQGEQQGKSFKGGASASFSESSSSPSASPFVGKWVAAPSAVALSQQQPEGLHLLQATPAAWSGDIAVAPASSAPDINAVLSALDGADSRPAALKAVQAGALKPAGAVPFKIRQASFPGAGHGGGLSKKQQKAALVGARSWDGIAEGPVGLASLLATSGHEAPATTGRGGRAGGLGGSGLQRGAIARRARSAERALAALPEQASGVLGSVTDAARRTALHLQPLPAPPLHALRDLLFAFAAVSATGGRNAWAAALEAAPILRRLAIGSFGAAETAVHNAIETVEERGPLVVQQTQQALANARQATAHAVQAVRDRAVSVGEEARRLASGAKDTTVQAASSAAQTLSSAAQTVRQQQIKPQPKAAQLPQQKPQSQPQQLQAQHLHATEWHVPSQQRSSAASVVPQESISTAGTQMAAAMVADERQEALRSDEDKRAALLSKQAALQEQISRLEHQRVAAEAAAAAASLQVQKAQAAAAKQSQMKSQSFEAGKPLVAPGATAAKLQPQQQQQFSQQGLWQSAAGAAGTQPMQAHQQFSQQQSLRQQQQLQQYQQAGDRPQQWQGPIGGTIPLPMQASTPGLAAVMGGGRPVDGISSPFP